MTDFAQTRTISFLEPHFVFNSCYNVIVLDSNRVKQLKLVLLEPNQNSIITTSPLQLITIAHFLQCWFIYLLKVVNLL